MAIFALDEKHRDIRLHVTQPELRKLHYVDTEVWLEVPKGQWIAFFRLLPQGGSPVVAEVRIFPGKTRRGPGTWTNWGTVDPAKVPTGGLTSRAMRTISAPEAERLAESFFAKLKEAWGDQIFERHGLLGSRGFGTAARASKRGRGAQLSEMEYAQVAARYVELIGKGSRSPIKELEKRLHLSADTVSKRIWKARNEFGLLTATGTGRPGGQLTPKAREILGLLPAFTESVGGAVGKRRKPRKGKSTKTPRRRK